MNLLIVLALAAVGARAAHRARRASGAPQWRVVGDTVVAGVGVVILGLVVLVVVFGGE